MVKKKKKKSLSMKEFKFTSEYRMLIWQSNQQKKRFCKAAILQLLAAPHPPLSST